MSSLDAEPGFVLAMTCPLFFVYKKINTSWHLMNFHHISSYSNAKQKVRNVNEGNGTSLIFGYIFYR